MNNGNARVIKTGEWVTVVQYKGRKGWYISIPSGRIYLESSLDFHSLDYHHGYEQAKNNILSLIESRISEIIGDAQPRPVLRAELEELINRIKDGKD